MWLRMQLLLAQLLVLLSKLAPSIAVQPCHKVSSSECSKDTPMIVTSIALETEEQCVNLCQAYADNTAAGCTFAVWKLSFLYGGTCTLYREPFADYISHCLVLAGPPDVSDCPVDDPPESSCHGRRYGECIQRGQILEIIESITSWRDCANICKGSPGSRCKAWTYRDEPIRNCFLFDSAERICIDLDIPSGIGGPLDCESETTNTTDHPEPTMTPTTIIPTANPDPTMTTTTTTTVAPPDDCKYNTNDKNSPCYLLNTEVLTFEEAETFCTSQGGHLASSLSQDEDEFIGRLLFSEGTNSQTSWWIGAQCGSMFCEQGNSWSWSDGSDWSFENWKTADGIPGHSYGCAFFESRLFKWGTYNCGSHKKSVCKI